MWRELENRVYKTRFIIQKNLKNLPSLKHSLTSPDRIRSERESQIRERETISERGRPDKRERKSQIREGEKEIARARPGRGTWGSRDPSHAAQAAGLARPRSCEPGFISSSSFFFFPLWLWFLFLLVLFCYIWAWNRVFKTRFSSGQHVKNDVTSDVIQPWKSSLKDSIYSSKSSLLDSSC